MSVFAIKILALVTMVIDHSAYYLYSSNLIGYGLYFAMRTAGQKLLRDRLWPVRGISRADNEYFKSHGLYDFPQRRWLYSLRLSVLGLLMRNEKLRAKIAPRLNHRRLAPYRKLLKQKRGGEAL